MLTALMTIMYNSKRKIDDVNPPQSSSSKHRIIDTEIDETSYPASNTNAQLASNTNVRMNAQPAQPLPLATNLPRTLLTHSTVICYLSLMVRNLN